jgi:hypothetical protein
MFVEATESVLQYLCGSRWVSFKNDIIGFDNNKELSQDLKDPEDPVLAANVNDDDDSSSDEEDSPVDRSSEMTERLRDLVAKRKSIIINEDKVVNKPKGRISGFVGKLIESTTRRSAVSGRRSIRQDENAVVCVDVANAAATFTLTDTFKALKLRTNRRMSTKPVSLTDVMTHPHCCSLFKVNNRIYNHNRLKF